MHPYFCKEIDRMAQQILSKIRDVEQHQKRIGELDSLCHALKEDSQSNLLLNSEISRLRSIVKEKETDIQEWRSSYLNQATQYK